LIEILYRFPYIEIVLKFCKYKNYFSRDNRYYSKYLWILVEDLYRKKTVSITISWSWG